MDLLQQGGDFFMVGVDPTLLKVPEEKLLKLEKNKKQLIIGVPKEVHLQENRVPLTPGAVGVLVANGHQVIIEHNAGAAALFTDNEYTNNGAIIAYVPEEVYKKANVIVKIAPLDENELALLQEEQIVISAVHLGAVRPDYLKMLLEKNISAFGFEFIQAPDGSIPIMQVMSEIAGITSITIASELLSWQNNGKGMLLGGITGVPPTNVTIIGAGTVGYHACRTAMALGALVKVIDKEVYKLKKLEQHLSGPIYTSISQQDYVAAAVANADVVIGAAYEKGAKAPCVVTEEMVAQMPEGSVIVDVAIDQGGCIETSRLTTFESPTFIKHGVIHFCVPNIPARVPRTASIAISNVLCPMVLKLGESSSFNDLFAKEVTFRTGIYTYHKHVTKRLLASIFNLDYMDIELLYAANL
ncbi:MAG: alanine dehydrogenase [Bacteroidia bacterium]|nr:alanine dehydrogenase [Bacteroidia bacterium]MDW8157776.1 alanine dehydrogenase [Bacteroidia bacterium]